MMVTTVSELVCLAVALLKEKKININIIIIIPVGQDVD